jgi:Leucine-rich repeat (LRR) protein
VPTSTVIETNTKRQNTTEATPKPQKITVLMEEVDPPSTEKLRPFDAWVKAAPAGEEATRIITQGRLIDCKHFRRAALNLDGLNLSSLPDQAFVGMDHLKKLSLKNNNLSTLPHSLFELSQLTTLDLSYNPLGFLPNDLSSLRKLTHLHINNIGLYSLPDSLGNLPKLSHIYASTNVISEVPLILSRSARLTFLDIRNNPLNNLHFLFIRFKALGFLQLLCDDHDIYLHHDLSRAVNKWYGYFLSEVESLKKALPWDHGGFPINQGSFITLLERLPSIAAFQSAAGKSSLFLRMNMILTEMEKNMVLCQQCCDLATEGLSSCSDRLTFTISQLETACLIHQIPENDISARLALGRKLFRQDRLDQFAQQDIEERERNHLSFDEIEIQLYYRHALHEQLSLPSPVTHMQFSNLAQVSFIQLRQAAAYVTQQEEDLLKVAEFICSLDFWQAYLQKEYASTFALHMENSHSQLALLDSSKLPEQVYRIEAERIQKEYHQAVKESEMTFTTLLLETYAICG